MSIIGIIEPEPDLYWVTDTEYEQKKEPWKHLKIKVIGGIADIQGGEPYEGVFMNLDAEDLQKLIDLLTKIKQRIVSNETK